MGDINASISQKDIHASIGGPAISVSRPAMEIDPLSLHLNQAVPQTIIGGIPLLASTRTINANYQLVDKLYVDGKVSALLPAYETGKFLTNNGTTLSWATVSTVESDPVFNAWLLATPPVYPAALAGYVPWTSTNTITVANIYGVDPMMGRELNFYTSGYGGWLVYHDNLGGGGYIRKGGYAGYYDRFVYEAPIWMYNYDLKIYLGGSSNWSISADATSDLNILREVGTGKVNFGAAPILTTGTLGAGASTLTSVNTDTLITPGQRLRIYYGNLTQERFRLWPTNEQTRLAPMCSVVTGSASGLVLTPSTVNYTDQWVVGMTLNCFGGIPTLFGLGAYLRIGDAGTTAHSLASEDDLMVTGKLEVKGNTYLDGTLGAGVTTVPNVISDIATGTKPFACTSTTKNDNLNADLLDGLHDTSFVKKADVKPITCYFETPIATDVIGFFRAPYAVTITKITYTNIAGTSITGNVENRTTLGTAGSDIVTSDFASSTSGVSKVHADFNDTNEHLAAGSHLVFCASAKSGDPTGLEIAVEYTID
jgi:hypothetical protein